jgi:hypothetical protein
VALGGSDPTAAAAAAAAATTTSTTATVTISGILILAMTSNAVTARLIDRLCLDAYRQRPRQLAHVNAFTTKSDTISCLLTVLRQPKAATAAVINN